MDSSNQEKVLKVLKQQLGKDQNLQDACVLIVSSGDLKALTHFLRGRPKDWVNVPVGRFGLTLLHLCGVFGQVEIAYYLLENGAKVDKKETCSGKTPLHLSAYFGNLELLKLLINYSKKFMPDAAGCYPLHYASMRGDIEAVRFLIKSGENPNCFSSVGTPLDIAIRKKNFPLVDLLSGNIGLSCLDSHGDSNRDSKVFFGRDGLSPVHLAIATDQRETAEMLLQRFPQYPSEQLKNEWSESGFLERFFAMQTRRDYLEMFYLSEDIPQIVNGIGRHIDRWSSNLPKDELLLDIFQSMVRCEMRKIKEIIRNIGKQALTVECSNSILLDFAESLCFSPLFEWMIETNSFPDLVKKQGFFSRWCLMEVNQSAGGFFQAIPKELEILTSRYHVVQGEK